MQSIDTMNILLCKCLKFDAFPQHISTSRHDIFVIVAAEEREKKDRKIKTIIPKKCHHPNQYEPRIYTNKRHIQMQLIIK